MTGHDQVEAEAGPSQGGQPENILKSQKSRVCSLVRFHNRTDRKVDIIWLNYEGARVKVRTLNAREFIDVNTFVGHPWIFIDVDSGERLMVELKEVFESTHRWSLADQSRRAVNITIPIYTLKDTCIRFLRHTLPIDSINDLELPQDLKAEIKFKFSNQFKRCLPSSATVQNGE